MNKTLLCLSCIAITGLSACSTLLNTPKYQFTDGYYTARISGGPNRKVYVDTEEEFIKVYPVKKTGNRYRVDTTTSTFISFESRLKEGAHKELSFRQSGFDVDFLSILFKYRPSMQGIPNQFTTHLNGAVYLGFRTDVYLLDFMADPLGKSKRQSNHYGFSFGLITGAGATAMNPWVTKDRIAIEYDGVVWTKGIAGILGLNKFTVGVAAGWDDLLDPNKRYWIYQHKPWFGVAFGLNLN